MRVFFSLLFFVQGYANPILIDQKIGKLFCIPACPNRGEDHREDLCHLIKNYHVRSFLLKQGTIKQAKDLIAWLKETANEPILVIADAEWGLAMTIFDAKAYPKNDNLSKLSLEKIYDIGKSIAKDCLNLGVQLNLAPVVDVNLNPNNPIIGARSFGSDPITVAANAYAIASGMKEGGLSICLKHFPGHGDVLLDTHIGLPISYKTLDKLYQQDLLPYIKLKDLSPNSIMVAHIIFTAIDSDYPATLSHKVIQFLKNLIGDDILVISDALNMRALTNYYDVEEIVMLAYSAGIDLLLYGDHIAPTVDKLLKEDIPKAIRSLTKFYQNNFLSTKQLDKKIKKIDSLSKF